MHKFLVCAYKSQDVAQSQKKFALSHDRETMTFRNSAMGLTACCKLGKILAHIRHFSSDLSLWLSLCFCIILGSFSAKLHVSHFSNSLSLCFILVTFLGFIYLCSFDWCIAQSYRFSLNEVTRSSFIWSWTLRLGFKVGTASSTCMACVSFSW